MEEKTAKLTIKENGVDVYYKKYAELVFDVMKNSGVRVTMYYPDAKSLHTGFVSMDNAKLDFDHMPNRGYHFSRIYDEDFNKMRYFLKSIPMSYQDAVFWDGDMYYLNLETAEVRQCKKVNWYRNGYACYFAIRFEDGEELELRTSAYDEKYVFLKP